MWLQRTRHVWTHEEACIHPSALPNGLLRVLKWPVALACLTMLPHLPRLLFDYLWVPLSLEAFEGIIVGAGVYFIAWLLVFRHAFSGSYVSTFEHELTHALFAWATLHKVTGLKVTWRQGGACFFEGSGGGNWLIAIAPYWFPTLSIAPLLVLPWVSSTATLWVHASLGFVLFYHLTSTWRETHREQTDLKETGWMFAAAFLPSANLLCYGLILCFALRGAGAVGEMNHALFQRSVSGVVDLWTLIWSLL